MRSPGRGCKITKLVCSRLCGSPGRLRTLQGGRSKCFYSDHIHDKALPQPAKWDKIRQETMFGSNHMALTTGRRHTFRDGQLNANQYYALSTHKYHTKPTERTAWWHRNLQEVPSKRPFQRSETSLVSILRTNNVLQCDGADDGVSAERIEHDS